MSFLKRQSLSFRDTIRKSYGIWYLLKNNMEEGVNGDIDETKLAINC